MENNIFYKKVWLKNGSEIVQNLNDEENERYSTLINSKRNIMKPS